MSEPVIKELSPELLDDFLSFFDHDAFADNPEWANCYCYWYLFPGTDQEWETRTGSENRAGMGELIRRGQAHGFLAYDDGRPVGWCHAAPRTAIPNIERFTGAQAGDADRVGSIVCFVVAEPHRRQGIARRLLEAACDSFRHRGLEFAEAYPSKNVETAAQHFPGPLEMYLEAGFTPVREFDRLTVVRKTLLDECSR